MCTTETLGLQVEGNRSRPEIAAQSAVSIKPVMRMYSALERTGPKGVHPGRVRADEYEILNDLTSSLFEQLLREC
jgi:hypothetical protein